MQLRDGIDAQIQQVFRNLRAVAAAAGATLDDAVKVTVFLTDLGHFAKVNQIMAEYFQQPYPARAAVGVASLPRGALVEIEAVLVTAVVHLIDHRGHEEHEEGSTRGMRRTRALRDSRIGCRWTVLRPPRLGFPLCSSVSSVVNASWVVLERPSSMPASPSRTSAAKPAKERGAARASPRKLLEKLGVRTDLDLVLHLPLRYEDETHLTRLRDALPGQSVQVEVEVVEAQIQFRPKRILVCRTRDGDEELTLRFFHFYPSQLRAARGRRAPARDGRDQARASSAPR